MFSDFMERYMIARTRGEQERFLEELDWEALSYEERREAGFLVRDLLDFIEEVQTEE